MQISDSIAVVSWDVDGTLYDAPALRQSVAASIARAGASRRWRTAREALIALREHKTADRRVRQAGGHIDPSAAAFWAGPRWTAFMHTFMLPALEQLGPHPGLAALLDEIDAAGRIQVVVSDFDAEAKLTALGLAGRFQQVFSGTQIGAFKPHALGDVHGVGCAEAAPTTDFACGRPRRHRRRRSTTGRHAVGALGRPRSRATGFGRYSRSLMSHAVFCRPLPLTSTSPRFSTTKRSPSAFAVCSLTCTRPGAPVDSMRLARFTVSPHKS